MRHRAIFLALLLVAAPAAAKYGWLYYGLTVADLQPTCNPSRPFWIIDGDTATDCSTGGGANVVTCICDAGGSSYTGQAPSGSDGVGYDEVLDEGVGLTKRDQVNFIGSAVACVDNAGSTRTDCTVSGGAETNDLEATDPPTIEDTEVYIGTGSGTGAFAPLSGDATMANTGAVTVADNSHDHTEANISDLSHTTETNDLESVATNAADGEVFIGTGAGTGAYVAGLAACAADEKPEYTPGAPDTFSCEAIGSLVEADITDLDHLTEAEARTGLIENGSAEMTVETLGTACTDGQAVDANATGGVDCVTTGGDVSGPLDALVVANDSHTHVEANVTDLSHTTDTGPSPDCAGTAVYQDGEGNCDTRNAGSNWENDLEEEGEINATAVTGNAADDQVILGSGASTAAYASIPDCTDAGGGSLNYTAATNTISCGTDAGAGGGMTSFDVQGDDGAPNTVITDADTLVVSGGTNIVTEDGDAGADTLSIALDLTGITDTQFLYDSSDALAGASQLTHDGTNITLDTVSGDFVESTLQVIEVYNNSGATLFKCGAVYVSGFNVGADLPEVDIADNDAAAMPALGLVQADIANTSAGFVVVSGLLETADTSTGEAWAAGAAVYVNSSGTLTTDDCGETLTETKPTGTGELIQAVARVVRVNATTGSLVIQGAGRSNDVPVDITIGANDTINTDSVTLDNTWDSSQLVSGIVLDTENPAAADISGDFATGLTITAGVIIEPDLNADSAPSDADFLIYDSTGTNFDWLTANAGTDITADLEEETHGSEHAENAADELTIEGLGTACTGGQVVDSDGSGGVDCITVAGDISGPLDATVIGANTVESSMIATIVHTDKFNAGFLNSDGTQCADAAEVTIGSWGKTWAVICTDNDASTVTFTYPTPDSWNASTVVVKLFVVQDAVDTSAFQSDVACRCVGDTETPAAYGTEQALDDTMTGTDALNVMTSAAVTAAGTCAAADLLQCQIQVDATGTTTAMATLNILGGAVEWTSTVGD